MEIFICLLIAITAIVAMLGVIDMIVQLINQK